MTGFNRLPAGDRGKATYTTSVTTNSDGTKTIVAKGYVYRPNDTTPYNTKTVQAIKQSGGKAAANVSAGANVCVIANIQAYC